MVRNAGRHRSLAGGDLTRPRLEDVAHQDIVDTAGVDAGSANGFRDGDRAEVDGRAAPQGRAEPPDRRPHRGDDDRRCHGCGCTRLSLSLVARLA